MTSASSVVPPSVERQRWTRADKQNTRFEKSAPRARVFTVPCFYEPSRQRSGIARKEVYAPSSFKVASSTCAPLARRRGRIPRQCDTAIGAPARNLSARLPGLYYGAGQFVRAAGATGDFFIGTRSRTTGAPTEKKTSRNER